VSTSGPPYSTNPYLIAITTQAGSVYNVTSDCTRLSYSRTLTDLFSPLRADEGIFEFLSADGMFTPNNVVNPIEVGQLISLKYIDVFSGDNVIHAYSGRIKTIAGGVAFGARHLWTIEALTDVDKLSRTFVDTPLLVNMPVSSLFTEVMTRTSIASYACDQIFDRVDYVSYDNKNVVGILNQIVKSGNYTLHADGAGTVRLRTRYYESTAADVGVVSAMHDLTQLVTGESIVNRVTVRSQPAKQLTDISTVAFLGRAISVSSGGSTGFHVSFMDPRNLSPTLVGSTIALVSGTDYAAFANSDGTGSNLTATLSVSMTSFGASAVASIFNGAGVDAWVTKFQVRGYPLLKGAPISYRYESASSQIAHGLYEASYDDMLITDFAFLQNIAQYIIGERSRPRSVFHLDLVNEQPLIWRLDVGDLLAVENIYALGTFSSMSIRSMRHEINMGRGEEHRVSYELRDPSSDVTLWLILDHDPFGEIDSDRILGP
jgi:hypothetical protein